MNINKDGKTLVFSDDEIDNETNGEKKVFVTKRINGKETHVKAKKSKPQSQTIDNNLFNFNDEVVIGVKQQEEKKELKSTNQNNKNKKRKKSILKNKITFFISSIFLIGIVVVFALTAPLFNIKNIEVNGNNIVTKENIISFSGLKTGENIFKFNSNSIIQKVKENKYIEDARIKRFLPNTIEITIQEREFKYQISFINSYVYIDKNGYILETSTIKKQIPSIVGFKVTENDLINKQRLETNDLESLSKINKILESAKAIDIDDKISEINIENEENYILVLESKNKKIHIGDSVNLVNKMLYIRKILEKEEGNSGTIFVNGDFSSGFKPYFREE